MKAQFCRVGNEQWVAYCDEHGLPVRKCGKLVVPKVSQSKVTGIRMNLRYRG